MFRLAQERENYLREKERNKQKLNQTYQYQIKHRIPELPKHYSDNEVSFYLNHTVKKAKTNISPTSQSCRQHISSPTSVTNIDVALFDQHWAFLPN